MLIPLFIMTCTFSIGAKEITNNTLQKSMAGIDISSLFTDDELNISISHAVGNGWSITGKASLRISSERDPSTLLHIEDLGLPAPEDKGRKESYKYRLSMDYWPKGTFNGPVISTGVETSETDTVECLVSTGYLCSIVCGLKAGFFLSFNINEAFSNRDTSSTRLSISLCYSF